MVTLSVTLNDHFMNDIADTRAWWRYVTPHNPQLTATMYIIAPITYAASTARLVLNWETPELLSVTDALISSYIYRTTKSIKMAYIWKSGVINRLFSEL